MELEGLNLLIALLAATGAGWIDAVVGGGGLVLLPILLVLMPGVPPATVMGTNKLAAVWGTLSAAISYLRNVTVPKKMLAVAVPTAIVGSAAGAALASAMRPDWLRPLIMALLLAVGLFVTFRPAFGTSAATDAARPATKRIVIALLGAAAISFYDGILGPGTGVFLIILFSSALSRSLVTSSAMAKVVNLSSNFGALIVFWYTDHIIFSLGLALAVANVLGALLGARMALRRGAGFVRIVLLVVVLALVIKLALDQWVW